jgi:hypothetical protein
MATGPGRDGRPVCPEPGRREESGRRFFAALRMTAVGGPPSGHGMPCPDRTMASLRGVGHGKLKFALRRARVDRPLGWRGVQGVRSL